MNKKYLYAVLAAVVVIGGAFLYQKSAGAYVSTDVAGLPEVKASEIVEL